MRNSQKNRSFKKLWHGLLTCLTAGILSSSAWAGSKEFSFTLPAAATTSAGVYLADGTLVRTLWSKKSLPSGANTAIWDGLDDEGRPAAAGNYSVKVLHHNVTYDWLGTIANTSSAQTGPSVHRGFSSIHDMAIAGTNIFTANNYNEGGGAWRRMSTTTPNAVTTWGRTDQARPLNFVTTDGTNVYYANTGSGWIPSIVSFVAAYKVSDNTETTFSSGVTDPAAGGGSQTWNNVINREYGQTNVPSGIAVQTSGSYLFVAHGGLNQIRVLNKTTGALVNTVTATNPGRLATTTDGNLWAITTESGNRVVRRYNVDGSGNLTAVAVVTGLSDPLAVAVSPSNGTVAIADGGTSQQVKGFTNVASGTPVSQWTLGTAGGYNATNGPNVSNTKFMFVDISSDGFEKMTYLAYQSDGSFWVGDPGNQRNLHFSSTRTYVEQVAYLSRNYACAVAYNAVTRVFGQGWLEYTVNYSATPKPSWSLSKNWTAGLPDNIARVPFGGLSIVTKLSNNLVYATANNSTTGKKAVLELTSTGARQTGIEIDSNQMMHEDGSIRYLNYGEKSTIYTKTLSGFDGSNNPLWNAATVLASASAAQNDPKGDSGFRIGNRFPSTSTNKILVSDGQGQKNVYHIGAINSGGTKWLWKAAPTGIYFNDSGQVGNGSYPANNTFTQGQNIVLGCHGEFYEAPNGSVGQANQFMHYWDNGLLVGQFGTDLSEFYSGHTFYDGVIAKKSGNSFSPAFVTSGTNRYVWHNDEGQAGGLHCWKLGNTTSIATINVSLVLAAAGGNGTGLTGQYFDGKNFETLKLTRTDKTVDYFWSGSPDTASGVPDENFSVRWSGLVQPLYSQSYTFYTQSDDGVRLWVNGNKIIDNWTDHGSTENTSTTVSLTAGQKYSIVMEYYDATTAAEARLSWSSSSQAKQIIPFAQLYPSGAIAINCGGPATGRFQADPAGYADGHAVSTASAITITGLTDPAPMSVYQNARMRSSQYVFQNLQPFANYKVRLHLAEFQGYTLPGQRVFKVGANRLGFISPNVDIVAEAGSDLKATIREFVVSASRGGEIQLSNEESPNWSLVGGIELTRDTSDPLTNPQFDLVGRGTGLKGEYFSTSNFTPLTTTRIDPEINFNFGTTTPPPTSVGPTNFSVRWTGKLQTIDGGSYEFSLINDEGAKLWVNGVLVINQFGNTSGAQYYTMTLNPSTQYDIKIEYQQTTGDSYMRFGWKRPNGFNEIVPMSQLIPAP